MKGFTLLRTRLRLNLVNVQGFTLIELMITIAIIGALSLVGSIKFNQFRDDAIINAAAEELASQIRSARNMSMVGVVTEGEVIQDFEVNGLPVYGVGVGGNSYFLFRDYTKKGESDKTRENLENVVLEPTFNITGDTEIVFSRRYGEASPKSFVIEKSGVSQKKVTVNEQGVVLIENL